MIQIETQQILTGVGSERRISRYHKVFTTPEPFDEETPGIQLNGVPFEALIELGDILEIDSMGWRKAEDG